MLAALLTALQGHRCIPPPSIDRVLLYGDSLWAACGPCAQLPSSWDVTSHAKPATSVWMQVVHPYCAGWGDPSCVAGEAMMLDCVGHPESCLDNQAADDPVVLIQFGTNDFRRVPPNLPAIQQAWTSILAKIEELDLACAVIHPPPILQNKNGLTCDDFNAAMNDHWAWLEPLARSAGCATADVYDVFRAYQGALGQPAFLELYHDCPMECTDAGTPAADCIHPSWPTSPGFSGNFLLTGNQLLGLIANITIHQAWALRAP